MNKCQIPLSVVSKSLILRRFQNWFHRHQKGAGWLLMTTSQILSTWLQEKLLEIKYDISPKANENSPQDILEINKNGNCVHFSAVLWQRNSNYTPIFCSSFDIKKQRHKETNNKPPSHWTVNKPIFTGKLLETWQSLFFSPCSVYTNMTLLQENSSQGKRKWTMCSVLWGCDVRALLCIGQHLYYSHYLFLLSIQ